MSSPTQLRDDGDTRRLRDLARLLDSAIGIPGTRIRMGLDSLLGLIPGGGDLAGALLSGIIVLSATRRGVPGPVLWRMIGNLVVDTVIGAIPLLGDIFDIGWKANIRNVELLERYAQHPEKVTARSRMLGAVAVAVVLLVVVGMGALAFLLLRALWQLLTA